MDISELAATARAAARQAETGLAPVGLSDTVDRLARIAEADAEDARLFRAWCVGAALFPSTTANALAKCMTMNDYREAVRGFSDSGVRPGVNREAAAV